MIEKNATIENVQGIHCRPSAVIVKELACYRGKIKIIAESGETDLKSVMGLLMLGLEKGTTITIQVNGPDEEQICNRLVELFQYHFDFPPREKSSIKNLTATN